MGALAPVSHWLPQDDLLLKDAVEAGASLESLAKGAVRFSQRFTIQELKDRWYSLLYDPVVSAEASLCMIEFERSASIAKFNKDTKCISVKRKAGSVRKCYSAMRKRICCGPFELVDISSLGGPGFINAENNNEPLSADGFFGADVSELFGIQESNFSIMHHAFPELQATGVGSSSDGISTSPFCTGLHDNDECESFSRSCPLNICPSFDDNRLLTGDQRTVKGFDQFKELEMVDLFESVDLDIKSSPIFEEIIDKEGNTCSGIHSNVVNASTSDCVTSLPNSSYSPIPQMPPLSAVEGLSCTLADVLGEEDHGGNKLVISDDFDAINKSVPGHSSVISKSELKGQMPGDGMKDAVPNAEEYFAELSNSLLNFTTEDDLLFVDAEGKDMIEKSYIENLSSLLLHSPDKSDNPDLGISDVAVAGHECLSGSSSAANPGESSDQEQYHCDDQPMVCSSEAQKLSSALKVNPAFPELRNGVICCILNTEDSEIPNNDDVFLPIRLPSISISSITHTKFDESYYPMLSSVKEFSDRQKATDRTLMESEQSNYSQLHVPSRMAGSSFQLEMDSPCQLDDPRVKFEPLNYDAQHAALRKLATCNDSALVNSAYSSKKNVVPGSGKDLLTTIEQPNNPNLNSSDSHIQKHAQASNPHLRFQKNASTSKQDVDGTFNIQNREALHAEFCSVETPAEEAIADPTVSDQEELSCEDDDDVDVPYFSDVEAMILDMDLSPDEQDLYYSPEVLRYQHQNAKRTVIRLEQAADAYLQRALSARRAFAVLYGRRSKHFIRKSEVLLGRATEDVKIDIDLGMEGHANRISRRQATIKMGNDGSFQLTNHGKFSIYVNGKEVIPNGNVGLVSGCLIEVRGLPFVFETSRTCIKQYLDNFGSESQSWEHKSFVSC